eukprot:TRINITY_DN6884_c0_g2_i9.p12 TRINITY_DN6884_c0_g2~~TRINITY_DN6884_c0_g2_i9.p12  ORF type:complete len:111 (-),score=0.59 TRINITY_DN6884_c0_g2_i9:361-693(-)
MNKHDFLVLSGGMSDQTCIQQRSNLSKYENLVCKGQGLSLQQEFINLQDMKLQKYELKTFKSKVCEVVRNRIGICISMLVNQIGLVEDQCFYLGINRIVVACNQIRISFQ